jgi:hypothetical protein
MQSGTDSLEVLRPFSTLETGSDQHRAYHTPLCCAPRLFQPPSALTPPVSVTALFHAAGTLGILPFRAFPLLKCVASLDARSPLDVYGRPLPKFPGIQPPLHPRLHRCTPSTYFSVRFSRAPCRHGASKPSVLRLFRSRSPQTVPVTFNTASCASRSLSPSLASRGLPLQQVRSRHAGR